MARSLTARPATNTKVNLDYNRNDNDDVIIAKSKEFEKTQ